MSAAGSPASNQPTVLPDPGKHVNYTLGMILGVDDFVQEFTYLNGRDQALARDLVGYGTVSGLQISVESDARGPRVVLYVTRPCWPRCLACREHGRMALLVDGIGILQRGEQRP